MRRNYQKQPLYKVYTLPHSDNLKEFLLNTLDIKKKIKILSCDPGVINFALRIETWHSDERITMNYYEKFSLKSEVNTLFKEDPTSDKVEIIYLNLMKKLASLTEYYENLDLIIIEGQPPIKSENVRLAHSIFCYFSMRDLAIIEVNTKLKAKMLGYKKGMNVKALSISEAMKLLEMRVDYESIKYVNSLKKKDDICDTVCQIEALMRHLEIAETKNWLCDE